MTKDRKTYIGALIRQARKSKGITSIELAEMLTPKKKPQTVTAWERGISSPDAESLSQIANLLEIDVRSFYGQEDSREFVVVQLDDPIKRDIAEFESCYARMSESQRRAVLAVASAMVESVPPSCAQDTPCEEAIEYSVIERGRGDSSPLIS